MRKHNRSNFTSASSLFSLQIHQRIREGIFICSGAVSIFLLLSLLSYHTSDPGWSHTGYSSHLYNIGGHVGAWFADVFMYLFGCFAYLVPVLMLHSAWIYLTRDREAQLDYQIIAARVIGVLGILIAGCALASLKYAGVPLRMPYSAGGVLGNLTAISLIKAFSGVGATLLLLGLFLSGITLFTGVSWLVVLEMIGRNTIEYYRMFTSELPQLRERIASFISQQQTTSPTQKPKRTPKVEEEVPVRRIAIAPKVEKVQRSVRSEKSRQEPLFDGPQGDSLPSLSLLDSTGNGKKQGFSTEKLESMSREVEQQLLDFGIEVQVVAVHPGPVITRFEMQLAPGVKVSKITTLQKDLARSLSVVSVRVVDVIPGKNVVGLEIPNEQRDMVQLSEVLSSQQFEEARSPLSLAMGVDISGHPVIVDLAKMPHLLVAGTTGSGKSVGLNAMLLSMLFKASPSEVRMILIDPKMLELSIYDDIPHLLAPVVTDMKEAAGALKWCVAEMERRYRVMSALGVRNVAGFNHKITEAAKNGEQIVDPILKNTPDGEPIYLQTLPYIVVVIDELADMMMVVGKKVEQLIARIAQKARAAGIHMILATQRPSVDVLTGLIKSNIPTRMAFQVSSKIDSRTILDQQGAEQLLGHGDMLYLPPGNSQPIRVHGAYVADHEVHKVTADWKKRGKPVYIDDIVESANSADLGNFVIQGEESGDTEDTDPLYDEAVHFILKSRKASISSVQRRFKIGYNRAARLLEEMERTGIVSSMESNGSREVLAPAIEE